MQAVVDAATALFNFFFHVSTGANDAPGAIATVVSLITSNSYLLVGIALTLSGAAVAYLARIIHS